MKKKWKNHHHCVPKSRNGCNHKHNLLLIDGNIHQKIHFVFGNRTLSEIIALLIRVQRAKGAQK